MNKHLEETTGADRLAELNAMLDGMPRAEAAQHMLLWNERSRLLQLKAAEDRLEEGRAAKERAEETAAAFQPKIALFRERAQMASTSFDAETARITQELAGALAGMTALEREYETLYVEGRSAGATIPPLRELSGGVDESRLGRARYALHFLSVGDA